MKKGLHLLERMHTSFTYKNFKINNLKAFTLSETLITVGIIGVVAALTLPSLINRTKNKELHTAFLKTYSELNQLAVLFTAHNGVTIPEYSASIENGISAETAKLIFSYYDSPMTLTSSGQGLEDADGNIKAFYNINYLNGKPYSGGANSSGRNSSFLCDNTGFRSTKSGEILILNDAPKAGENGPVICVDINGTQKPNRYGIDYFMFIFTTDGKVLPMGQEHKNNPPNCKSGNGICSNFNNIGSEYCSTTSSNITENTSCAYYALINIHPTKKGKDYWHDFLGEVYNR